MKIRVRVPALLLAVAIAGACSQPSAAAAGGSRTVSHTFSAPGRYLVICAFIPHLNLNMYGWVEVRARQQ